jgi:hypothetical protein
MKSDKRNILKFRTLDALVKVSLCGKEVQVVDSFNIFEFWIGTKH